jgi:hypothetical protein
LGWRGFASKFNFQVHNDANSFALASAKPWITRCKCNSVIPAKKNNLLKTMASPPKPEDDNVAPSSSPEDGNAEGEQGPKQTEEGVEKEMEDSHDIDVKEQDRWLPIANG